MNNILDELYRRFYHPASQTELKREVEDAHRQLIERLEKPERKLVLKIIDTKDTIAGIGTQESFNCGFWLAWQLFTQLHEYDGGHSVEKSLNADGRFSVRKEEVDENLWQD